MDWDLYFNKINLKRFCHFLAESLFFIHIKKCKDIFNKRGDQLNFKTEPTSPVQKVLVYTDGASRGNGKEHSVSAYAYFLKWGGYEKTFGKAFENRTNNQMEMLAVIEALKAMKREDIPIELYADSALVVNCLTQHWYRKWERDGWTKKGGLKNADLWKELIYQYRRFKNVSIIKVKGHSTNEYNNLVDKECNEKMDEMEAVLLEKNM